jgi:hypothetical protein
LRLRRTALDRHKARSLGSNVQQFNDRREPQAARGDDLRQLAVLSGIAPFRSFQPFNGSTPDALQDSALTYRQSRLCRLLGNPIAFVKTHESRLCARYAARGVTMIRESSRFIGDRSVPNVPVVPALRSVLIDRNRPNVQQFKERSRGGNFHVRSTITLVRMVRRAHYEHNQ